MVKIWPLKPNESVVAVAFQSTFRTEMHQNDVFLFFLKLFLRSAIKMIQNIQKNLFLLKQKNLKSLKLGDNY
jgi:hypothetical protein